MEKAKEFATNYLNEPKEENPKMDRLRPDINNLLHVYLPGNITLDQADAIAITIYDIIIHPLKYLKNE